MPLPPARALIKGVAAARTPLLQGARAATNYVVRGAQASRAVVVRAAKSTPGKLALGGVGAGTGLFVAGKGLEAAIHSVRQGFDAPTSQSTLDVLTSGVTPEDAARDQEVRNLMTPGPAEFLTSTKGWLLLAIVGVVVVLVLMRRGK